MAEIQTSAWSETAASNNSAPPDGWPEGMDYDKVNDASREEMAALKRAWNRDHLTVTSAGTADVQTLTYTTAPTAYIAGLAFWFIAGAALTNTGACTINVNALGAKSVKRPDGSTNPSAGDITAGKAHLIVYDGTNFRLLIPYLPSVIDANAVVTTSILDLAVTLPKIAVAAKTHAIIMACSDETTALTTGTGKIELRAPYAFTVTGVRASLTTAQASGSIFTVDINEAGTTILSTKLTIDNNEKTSTTAATPAVISDTAIADDAIITVDIDQIGNGTAKGLKVYLIGYKTT